MEEEVAILEVLFVDESVGIFEAKPESVGVEDGFLSFLDISEGGQVLKAFNERIIKLFSVKVKE